MANNANLTLNDLADMITNIKMDLTKDLTEKINNLHLHIDEKFSVAICEVKEDIVAISKRQDCLEDKFDRIERQLHMNDLLLNGIPKKLDEDLQHIVNIICTKIKFTNMESTILSTFRCNNRSAKPTIIMKFISSTARNKFYRLYVEVVKKTPIVLADMGFSSNDRISLQESLSPPNAVIFRKAIEIKKQSLIYSVFTQNGFVKIRVGSDTNPILISDIHQLVKIASCSTEVHHNKRKFNNSSTAEDSSITENDPKILKSSNLHSQRNNIHNSTPIIINSETSSSSSSPYLNTTIIAHQQ